LRSGIHCGVAFHAINWLNRSAGLGITIGDKSFWGRGYGTDAMRIMMRLGFDKMNLHRLWLHVYDYISRDRVVRQLDSSARRAAP